MIALAYAFLGSQPEIGNPYVARTRARWEARSDLRRDSFPHGRLIVSLTSYPPRFATLHLTLQCLLSQTLAPDAVVLWIAKSDMDALPRAVRCLEADGLVIRACADLKSYKKIVPSLDAYPGAFVATADDDVYYDETWLAQLAGRYVPGTHDIICHRAHEIRHVAPDKPLPYLLWRLNTTACESPFLFLIGCGGVFYPPGSLHPDATAAQHFTRLCPTADDVWLNWMAWRAGSAIRRVPGRHRLRHWPGSQMRALHHVNVIGGANQKQLRAMIDAYGYPPAAADRRHGITSALPQGVLSR